MRVRSARQVPGEQTLLEVSGRWLKALTDGSGEIVTLADEDGRIQYMSMGDAAPNLTGFDSVMLSGKLRELVHPDDRQALLAAFDALIDAPLSRNTMRYRLRHRDGRWIHLESTAANLLDDPVIGAVIVHTRAAPPAVDNEAGASVEIDPARHLKGRAAFLRAVTDAVERAQADEKYGFALLILELDRLKMLAGSYGQEVVDELIEEVGRRLVTLLRPEDTMARLVGGEHAILLDGIAEEGQAARVVDRIQKTVGAKYHILGHSVATSAIVGIATSERKYDRAESVMRDAALAAHRAGGQGRRRRAVFQTQMRVEDTRYMSLVANLHNALQTGQLKVHYQPIVSLSTRTMTGVEALVRWHHPEQGIISPTRFIPVAEDTGLIVQLGSFVMREACRQMAEWNRTYATDPPLYVSINLSAKQFVDDDLHRQVERVLDATELDAHHLRLEITESAVLDNRDAAVTALGRLKERGVRISLDDFGTGYSSFSHLYQLPYDTLKIDRSFVTRIGEGGENSEIIHAIIVLAHNLRMDVVAEGVETSSQASQLKNMWCEYAQGYFFARPLDSEATGKLIAQHPAW